MPSKRLHSGQLVHITRSAWKAGGPQTHTHKYSTCTHRHTRRRTQRAPSASANQSQTHVPKNLCILFQCTPTIGHCGPSQHAHMHSPPHTYVNEQQYQGRCNRFVWPIVSYNAKDNFNVPCFHIFGVHADDAQLILSKRNRMMMDDDRVCWCWWRTTSRALPIFVVFCGDKEKRMSWKIVAVRQTSNRQNTNLVQTFQLLDGIHNFVAPRTTFIHFTGWMFLAYFTHWYTLLMNILLFCSECTSTLAINLRMGIVIGPITTHSHHTHGNSSTAEKKN